MNSTQQFSTDFVVIGAGAVGLAIAHKLTRSGKDVLILEAENAFGTQTSSRNSEVIHAGLYYPTDSLKAQLCVAGLRQLYPFLERHNIAHQRCGKLVVAIEEDERENLHTLAIQALNNDVQEIDFLTPAQAFDLEPELSPHCTGALLSGTTGIFDSHNYMLALLGLIEDEGGLIAFNAPVLNGEVDSDGIKLQVGGSEPSIIHANWVINAAGHGAIPLAVRITGPHQTNLPQNHWVKGSYFTVTGKAAFSRLIYPMHTSASLGLHLTIDLGGRMRLGPDAEWLPETAEPPFDYKVDPKRAEHFYASVRRYWPGLPDNSLAPDYSGIRPKIVGPGEPSGDFYIEGPSTHGTAGLVNLFGIESPGLTSSLAIGDYVADLVEQES